MITKGLDFKNVQLVGIMNLESSMNFPDFRSNERCFQLVQQVAGRAGRATERGEVFIQTYNSNPKLVNQIVNGDYEKFFQIQINDREKFKYPPFSKLIQLTVKHKNLNVVNNSSKWLFDKLKQKDNYSDLTIDDIRSLCTFGDVWYHDLTQSQIIWGEWLINK